MRFRVFRSSLHNMYGAAFWPWFLVGAVSVQLCLTPFPTDAADPSREAAARALLAEGEKQNEATDPYSAISIFERVQSQFPDTEAAQWAEYRRAESLMFLWECDEAIALARSIIQKNPGTLVSCWAQYCIGQSLLKKGQESQAILELR